MFLMSGEGDKGTGRMSRDLGTPEDGKPPALVDKPQNDGGVTLF
jgi:hypothetical protein